MEDLTPALYDDAVGLRQVPATEVW